MAEASGAVWSKLERAGVGEAKEREGDSFRFRRLGFFHLPGSSRGRAAEGRVRGDWRGSLGGLRPAGFWRPSDRDRVAGWGRPGAAGAFALDSKRVTRFQAGVIWNAESSNPAARFVLVFTSAMT
jgi:hypothetical protein